MARNKSPKQLTHADVEIWNRIAKTANPLSDKDKNFNSIFAEFIKPQINNAPNAPMANPSPNKPAKNLRNSTTPVFQAKPNLKNVKVTETLDLKTTRKISKGKITIDGRIDLHGLTQNAAHDKLFDYIENAFYSGNRIVLVITGKGNLGQGVLRENVPKWLTGHMFAAMVSSFGDAHSAHGGAGALYVRIRRRR